jgi:hypothetical protein
MRLNIFLLILLILAAAAYAHDVDSPVVKVRIRGFDPATNTYNFSCEIPPWEPWSQVDPLRFHAIDPIPQGSNASFRQSTPYFSWRLNAENYTELVHKKAMYHIYCEVQNYSAPPGEQNMASEVHVDLRTDENKDVPNIYVLASYGANVTLKCDPPDGVRDAQISWTRRNRKGAVDLPSLSNQRIVNITLPEIGSGWDVVCKVTDKNTGKTSSWDMPLELFAFGAAYVPTIEGCFPNEPCTWVHPSGTPPNSTVNLTILPGNASIYINEQFKGVTDANGRIVISNVIPGIYNLVARKNAYEELSTLIPLAAGKTLTRTYAMQLPTANTDPYNMCHSSMKSLPATCTGNITSDIVSGSCRTIACSSGGNSLKVQACNKPGDVNPAYFEMYKQSQTGAGVRICLGMTCIENEGFVRSSNFPICLGNATQNSTVQNISFASISPSAHTTVISEPNNQVFSYILSNPSALGTTSMWHLNGSIVGGGTTYTFIGNYTSSGTYNVTLTVKSSKNNLTQSWQLIVTDTVQNATNQTNSSQNATNATACFNSVAGIPANCTGGSITTDSGGNCRTIVCTNAADNMKILACDKSGFFEMYKQQQVGSSVRQICVGTTCISDAGYARSASFPVCLQTTANNTNASIQPIAFNTLSPSSSSVSLAGYENRTFVFTLSNPDRVGTSASWLLNGLNQTTAFNASSYTFYGANASSTQNITLLVTSSQNVLRSTWILTTSPSSAVCSSSVATVPATCTGGTITSDAMGGCRTINCASGADSMKIMACNKPDGTPPQYFEMYKQQQVGSSVTQICLGATCIRDNGYARSANYPMC